MTQSANSQLSIRDSNADRIGQAVADLGQDIVVEVAVDLADSSPSCLGRFIVRPKRANCICAVAALARRFKRRRRIATAFDIAQLASRLLAGIVKGEAGFVIEAELHVTNAGVDVLAEYECLCAGGSDAHAQACYLLVAIFHLA